MVRLSAALLAIVCQEEHRAMPLCPRAGGWAAACRSWGISIVFPRRASLAFAFSSRLCLGVDWRAAEVGVAAL